MILPGIARSGDRTLAPPALDTADGRQIAELPLRGDGIMSRRA
jgi:hypothetical protein